MSYGVEEVLCDTARRR